MMFNVIWTWQGDLGVSLRGNISKLLSEEHVPCLAWHCVPLFTA